MARARRYGVAPVPAWGARLMRRLHSRGTGTRDIARILSYDARTVRRVLRHYHLHKCDRVPRQGKGRRDCVSWVFAGPRGPQAVAALKAVKESGDARDLLKEVSSRFRRQVQGLLKYPAYSTLCRALRVRLNFRRKRVAPSSPPSAPPPAPRTVAPRAVCQALTHVRGLLCSCQESLASATPWPAPTGRPRCC